MSAWLAREAGDEPEVRAEVASLLVITRGQGPFSRSRWPSGCRNYWLVTRR